MSRVYAVSSGKREVYNSAIYIVFWVGLIKEKGCSAASSACSSPNSQSGS